MSVCLVYTIHSFSLHRILAAFLTAACKYLGYVSTLKFPHFFIRAGVGGKFEYCNVSITEFW
jgi:hypothetical protein